MTSVGRFENDRLRVLEHAHRWYDSEEYRELKSLRLAAVRSNGGVFMEGL